MAKSGLYGMVNGQSTVRNWSLNRLSNPKQFVASNTNTGTGTRKGALDWNGSFQCYGGSPLVLPGQVFTFTGFTTGTVDGAKSFSGQAIVDQVALTINYGAQDIVSYSVNFSADGALEEGTLFGEDATYPDAPASADVNVSFFTPSDDPEVDDPTIIPDMTQLVLTLSAANKPYVNSSTKVAGKVWTRRLPGPKNWTCAITRHDAGGVSGIDLGDYINLLIEIGSKAWDLKWGAVGDHSGLTVNVETGDVMTVTHNLTMDVAPAAEEDLGYVNTPVGHWLPVATP